MEKYFTEEYDADEACALYVIYESGDDSVLNDLIKSLLPLVRRTYLRRISALNKAKQDELESDAIMEVYRLVSGKELPTEPYEFTKYLATTIKRAFYDAITASRLRPFEFGKRGRYPAAGEIPNQYDVENCIYERELMEEIRRTVKLSLRFAGEEHAACSYIADCLLARKSPSPRGARTRFHLNVRRFKYLERYVKITIKAASWEIRDRDREKCSASPNWTTGGGLLCSFGKFKQVYLPA